MFLLVGAHLDYIMHPQKDTFVSPISNSYAQIYMEMHQKHSKEED